MKIFRDSSTFGKPTWICFYHEYMYTGLTLTELFKQILFEWKQNKHIIG